MLNAENRDNFHESNKINNSIDFENPNTSKFRTRATVKLQLTCIEEESFTCGLNDPIEITLPDDVFEIKESTSDDIKRDRKISMIVTKVT